MNRYSRSKCVILAATFSVLLSAGTVPALTVFDPANFGQNVRQVAESVKAFAQRNQQLLQLIATAANTARSVQGLTNGQYTAVFGAVNSLGALDQQYAGTLHNAHDLVVRSTQLMNLANRIQTPQDAIAASDFAITLTSNVISDSSQLLSALEPSYATGQKLANAMTASSTATGETQAIQAQTQLHAVNAQIEMQQYEIARLQLANELAREQKAYLESQRSKYRLAAAADAMRQPVPSGTADPDLFMPIEKSRAAWK
jgi:conjugal transfer/entry exclusion protein